MPGQFNTRRNPDTGRLEKIPEDESTELQAAAGSASGVTQEDTDFMARNAESEPPPPPPVQPLPIAVGDAEGEAIGEAAEAASTVGSATATGAGLGSSLGPLGTLIGAAGGAAAGVVGAGLGFVAGSQRDKPIASLEGGSAGGNDETAATLKALLDVQRGIARVGAPIKNFVKTTAAGSRM